MVIEVERKNQVIFQLRDYQKRAVDITTENWIPRQMNMHFKNFIIVAPTGSGKTAIFIECTRYSCVELQSSERQFGGFLYRQKTKAVLNL